MGTIKRWYYKTLLINNDSSIAVVFSKPYFRGKKYVIKSPRGYVADLDDSVDLPFIPKSIVSSPGYNISIQLDGNYDYHPPSRCLNFIDENICFGNIMGMNINRSI